MKKFLILALSVILLLPGCSFSRERIKEPVRFYYLQKDIQYRSEDGVITWEEREASGHRDNLSYLLAIYRMGPVSEELSLPFPAGTAILMMKEVDEEIHLILGNTAEGMSDVEFSLACACLTLTCTELTGIQNVTVTCGQKSLTMSRDSILRLDTSMSNATEETK